MSPISLEGVRFTNHFTQASETVHFISLNVYSDACPSAYSLAGAATVPNTPQKPPTMPDLPNSVPPELPPLSKSALFK
eukprot:1974034-Amphidinium_carterae.2